MIPLANLPDYYNPLELVTPPEFDGKPRNLMAAPDGYFCPCCPIELTAPMAVLQETQLATGAIVVFRCQRCRCALSAKRVRQERTGMFPGPS